LPAFGRPGGRQMIPLPWTLLGAGLSVLILFLGGYHLGGKHADQACAARQAESLRRALAQAEAVAAQDREVLAGHEAAQVVTRSVFYRLGQEANRYALAHSDDVCGLDADGVRVWDAANAGADAALAAPQPDYALRPAAAPGERARPGAAGQSRGIDAALPGVHGAAPGAVGLGDGSLHPGPLPGGEREQKPHWGWQ
jgi:hypothetical protein